MKIFSLSVFLALTALAMPAQTARKFSASITPDGRAVPVAGQFIMQYVER